MEATMRVWILVLALGALCFSSAQSVLVVYPFEDQGDYTLGTLVADAVATAFEASDTLVFGPDLVNSALPPMWVPSGFLSLTRLTNDYDMFELSGAQLLQGAFQADLAVTGGLSNGDAGTTLTLYLATSERTTRRAFTADFGDYDRLARFAIATITEFGFIPRYSAAYHMNDRFEELVFSPLLFALTNSDTASAKRIAQRELNSSDVAIMNRARTLAQATLGTDDSEHGRWRHVFNRLNAGDVPDAELAEEFLALAEHTASSNVALLWAALLYLSDGNEDAATRLLTRFDMSYPYARQVARTFLFHESSRGVDTYSLLDWFGPLDGLDMAGLFVTSAAAFDIGTAEFEAIVAGELARTAPYLSWAFEQHSFAAFDMNDALTAASVLAAAVEVQPDSALFWTNLGWAYYLLGNLAGTITASQTAIELPDASEVPYYNLGLANAVQNNFDDAYDAYINALSFGIGVHEASLEDLVEARELYPESAGVAFFLGFLAQEDGQRGLAGEEFERFLAFPEQDALWQPYRSYAEERLTALNAPPAAIVIEPNFALHLGVLGSATTTFHPGDAVAPVFELTTPGFELPRAVELAVNLLYEGGIVYEVTYPGTLGIPEGAVGYVIDDLSFTLDRNLPAGAYNLELVVLGDADQQAAATVSLELMGSMDPHRVLFSHNVQLLGLESGRWLNTEATLKNTDTLVRTYLADIALVIDEASNVIPYVDGGRFAGLTGGEAFAQTSESDVLDFLTWLADSPDYYEHQVMFVDVYADWVINGTP